MLFKNKYIDGFYLLTYLEIFFFIIFLRDIGISFSLKSFGFGIRKVSALYKELGSVLFSISERDFGRLILFLMCLVEITSELILS